MPSTTPLLEARVGPPFRDGRRFGGLSNRALPVQLSRVECPDLLNADFSERGITSRPGFTRVFTTSMKDASLRLDGINDYARIPHIAAYQPTAGQSIYVGIGVVLRGLPAASTSFVIAQKGYGVAGNLFFRLAYDMSGTGQWTAYVWDGAALQSYVIADGDGIVEPQGRYRFIEWWGGNGGASTFRFYDDAGNVSTSATTTAITTFATSSEDWTLGIPMSASGTISSADAYAPVTLCEFRYSVATLFPAAFPFGVYQRELNSIEHTIPGGYWKLNDATAVGTLVDSGSGANNGSLPNNAAEWTNDATLCLGQSALKFNGSSSWIHFQGTGALIAAVFQAAAPNVSRWTVRGLTYLTSSVDQAVLWAGTSTTDPQPVGVRVVSDQFQAKYDDGGTIRTLTITAIAVSAHLNKKIRWALYRHGTGTGTLVFTVVIPSGTGYTTYTTSIATTSASAGTVSNNWALARHVTSFSYPFTFHTDGALRGTLDDVQLIHTNQAAQNVYVGIGSSPQNTANGGPLTETASWVFLNPVHNTIAYMKMNEGAGNILGVTGAYAAGSFLAKLLPEEQDGGRWDLGLVEPYIAPETSWMGSYDRLLKDGTFRSSLLAISGATLYEVDLAAGTYTPVGAGLLKGSSGYKWTSARYASRLILAAPNGQRPWSWDGSTLDKVGIQQPLSAPVVTTAAGGSFAATTYVVYYTFRNTLTGAESNPSPATTITTSLNDKIDQIILSTSSDPQVNERRIYVTLAGGAAGTTAYLSTTISDNTTTTYTTDITAPPTSGTSLEYLTNQEAPQASTCEMFKDYLFLGGNQEYPTRVYRNVTAGDLDGWDQDVYYNDVTLDTGDPVVAFLPLEDRLLVDFRDGRGGLYLTGSTSNPFMTEIIQRDHGSVGPQARARSGMNWFYMSERDAWKVSPYYDENVSSPEDQSSPSIRYTLKNELSGSRRHAYVGCANQSKRQIWFAVSSAGSSRNDITLVYDQELKLWSKYDLPLDFLVEYEDANGDPQMYGSVLGRVCKLETGSWDGTSSALAPTLSSGSANSLIFSGTPFAGLALTGLRIRIYRTADNTVQTYTILRHTDSVITTYETVSSITTGDLAVIGGIPFYVEFMWDFGDPTSVKRLRWLKVAGISDHASNYLRVSYKTDVPQRSWTYTNVVEAFASWTTTDAYKLVQIGGLGRTVRIRLAESGLSTGSSSQAIPSAAGKLTFLEIAAEAELTDLK